MARKPQNMTMTKRESESKRKASQFTAGPELTHKTCWRWNAKALNAAFKVCGEKCCCRTVMFKLGRNVGVGNRGERGEKTIRRIFFFVIGRNDENI